MIVLHHAEEGFIGREDGTLDIPGRDSQNVGVDQAPDLRFTIFEIAVKSRILERDGRLRRKHLQNGEPFGSENVGG